MEYLREQLVFKNRTDFRLETALGIMERYGATEGNIEKKNLTTTGYVPKELLDKKWLEEKLMRDQKRLLSVVQYFRMKAAVRHSSQNTLALRKKRIAAIVTIALMNKKRDKLMKYLLLFIILFFSLISCDEDEPIATSNDPYIKSIGPEETFVGDILVIYGSGFLMPGENRSLHFDPEIILASEDCIKWNNIFIYARIPEGASSGTFSVEVNGIMSNIKNLNIEKLPPIDMIEIPAGDFYMGSETGFEDEAPVHKVTISNSFYISKYEISNRLWHAVTGNTNIDNYFDFYPAFGISWMEAVKFCNSLSNLYGLDTCYEIDANNVTYVNASGFRLPTEAEWEYACRAGTDTDYGGNNILADMGWYSDNSAYKLQIYGEKAANDFGIYDMHGNVWEWCRDYYADDYYSQSPSIDPEGPDSGERRLARGGSYNSGNTYCRSANRTVPGDFIQSCGIRVVRNKE